MGDKFLSAFHIMCPLKLRIMIAHQQVYKLFDNIWFERKDVNSDVDAGFYKELLIV